MKNLFRSTALGQALLTGLALSLGAGAACAQSQAESSGDIGDLKPSDEVLRKTLTPLQYAVTQEEDTEPPFRNEYHDN